MATQRMSIHFVWLRRAYFCLPTRIPFLVAQKLHLCLNNPVILILQGFSAITVAKVLCYHHGKSSVLSLLHGVSAIPSLITTATGSCCISTERSKRIRDEYQERNKLKYFEEPSVLHKQGLSLWLPHMAKKAAAKPTINFARSVPRENEKPVACEYTAPKIYLYLYRAGQVVFNP